MFNYVNFGLSEKLFSAFCVYLYNQHTQYPHVGVAPIPAPTFLFLRVKPK